MLRIKNAFQRLRIVVHLWVAKFVFDSLHLCFNFRHARVSIQSKRESCLFRLELWVLRQIAEGYTFSFDDCSTFFRRMFTNDQLKQRRFPCAVGTDETDLLVVLYFPV